MKKFKKIFLCLIAAVFCLYSAQGNAGYNSMLDEDTPYVGYYTTTWGEPVAKSPWKYVPEILPYGFGAIRPVELETIAFCVFGMVGTYGMIFHPAEGLAAIGTFYGIPKIISIWRDMRFRLRSWMRPMDRKS